MDGITTPSPYVVLIALGSIRCTVHFDFEYPRWTGRSDGLIGSEIFYTGRFVTAVGQFYWALFMMTKLPCCILINSALEMRTKFWLRSLRGTDLGEKECHIKMDVQWQGISVTQYT